MRNGSENFKKRLVEVLKEQRQTWWAENLKQSQSAVGKWLKDSFPRSDKLYTILRLSDVSANWILFGIGPRRLSDFDENETERRQDQGREVQVQLIRMTQENEKLRERVAELEREVSQNSIEWLFKEVDKKDAEDGEKEKVFNYNIFPVLALMRQINDVAFKVLEKYAMDSIDDKRYRKIADYIKRSHQKNNFELKKILLELDEIIK
jgi:hypothetical protein